MPSTCPTRVRSPRTSRGRSTLKLTPARLLCSLTGVTGSIRDHLLRVGIDNVTHFVTSVDGLPTGVPQVISPADLENFDAAMVLDVRNRSEHAAGHVPGSEQLSAGRVLWHQDELPEEGTVVTYCQSGVRNSVAASALRRAGHDIAELDGSFAGWTAWASS